MKTLRALFIWGLLLVATHGVSGKTATTDITIYVQSSDAPYLYAWVYDGTEGYTCNGDWPGTLMAEQAIVMGTTFWKKTFSEDDMHGISPLNIIFNDGQFWQTTDISDITSDSYFTYDGYGGYTNVTSQYAIISDAPVQNGSYYLRNVATGKFWGCGSKWGTQASVVDLPLLLTLIYQPDGTYIMEVPNGRSIFHNSEAYHYFGFDTEQETYYMDQRDVFPSYIVNLTIAKNGKYYTVSEGAGHFGYDGTTALGKKTSVDNTTLWEIITEEQYKAEIVEQMATATASNPVEITGLIGNSDFNNYGYWEIAADNDLLYKLDGGGTDNETDNNFCAESWHSDFYLHQNISSLPSGKYKLTAQGFYHQDGSDETHLPVFFANGQTSMFINNTNGTENDMATAARSFTNGLYPIEPIFVNLKEEGDLTIGAKLEGNNNLWCIWDNFRLYYLGQDQGLMGDVNGDGVVDLSDAAMVVFYSLGKNPAGFVEAVADMNSDGVIDFSDALIIKEKSF